MGKFVVITGASSGIGAATSHLFSKNGWHVILMGRNLDHLKRTQSLCAQQTSIISCDLSKPEEIENAINSVAKVSPKSIQCLVNNAGIFEPVAFKQSTLTSWRNQFEVNLFGAIHLTQGLLPLLKSSQDSAIVNVSSTLGLKPTANTGAYSASKAAMISWTQSLALELGPQKIRVNCVCPGLVDTPIHSFHALPGTEKKAATENLGPLQPLGRIGTPEEIAKSIYFLGSEDSSWTTGAILSVDGGINLT